MGEGWKAPPLPADLARAMSTQDLEQIQEHERGEIEDEEAEKEDEDETQEMIDTQYMGENEEERTVDELEVVLEQEQAGGQAEEHTDPLPPSIDGYLLGEHIQGYTFCAATPTSCLSFATRSLSLSLSLDSFQGCMVRLEALHGPSHRKELCTENHSEQGTGSKLRSLILH